MQIRILTRRTGALLELAAVVLALTALPANGAFVGAYALDNFTLSTSEADGTAVSPDNGLTLIITGGNNGSGLPGEGNAPGATYFLMQAPESARIFFHYLYTSFDTPRFDTGGYFADDRFWPLAEQDAEGDVAFSVVLGERFGFGVETVDNTGGPGVLTITNFEAQTGVPEPGAAFPMAVVTLGYAAYRVRQRRRMSKENKA